MENGSLRIGRTAFGSPADRGRLPSRAEALTLLGEWVANPRLQLHMRQVAALLEAWARERLNAPDQADLWYLAGLLHDTDWDKWPETHPQKTIAWLEERHYDPELIHAVAAHGPRHFGVPELNDLDRMIFAFDELSGFVHAVSLVRPGGYEGMEPSSVKKKLKEKSFAAQVDRQDITDGLEAAALTFEDLCAFVIRVQKQVG